MSVIHVRKIQGQTGTWRVIKPVVDKNRCIKCGTCQTFCPDSAIHVTPEGAEVDYIFCKGCGICANECPVKCISMEREG